MQEISHLHRGLDIRLLARCATFHEPTKGHCAFTFARQGLAVARARSFCRASNGRGGCWLCTGAGIDLVMVGSPDDTARRSPGVPQPYLLQKAPSAGAASGTREEQIWCVSRRELVYVGTARNHRGAVVHTYGHARSVCQTYEKRSFTLQGFVRRRAGRWSR
jgi:hypothetical protein